MFGPRQPNVHRLARRSKPDALIAALQYRDHVQTQDGRYVDVAAVVRRDAAVALVQHGTEAATRAVLDLALTDESPQVRQGAVEALRGNTEDEVVAALTWALIAWREPQFATARDAVVSALGDLPPAGIAAIARTLRDQGVYASDDDLAVLVRLLKRDPATTQACMPELVDGLGDDDPDVRQLAVRLLSMLAPASTTALIDALQDDACVGAAAEALGECGDGEAVMALRGLLGDEDPAHRAAAVRALGRLRDPWALDALLAAVDDDDFHVRVSAAAALDGFGSVAIVASVAKMVRPVLEAAATPALTAPEAAAKSEALTEALRTLPEAAGASAGEHLSPGVRPGGPGGPGDRQPAGESVDSGSPNGGLGEAVPAEAADAWSEPEPELHGDVVDTGADDQAEASADAAGDLPGTPAEAEIPDATEVRLNEDSDAGSETAPPPPRRRRRGWLRRLYGL